MKLASNATALVIVMLGLTGCATVVPSAYVSPQMAPRQAEPVGAVFGSIGFNPKHVHGRAAQRLHLRKIGDKTRGNGSFISYGRHGDRLVPEDTVEFGSFVGTTFFAQLPVGEYEFYWYQFEWRIEYNAGGIAGAPYSTTQEFSLPFKVQEGKAQYLGEIALYISMKEGPKWKFITLPSGGHWVVSDMQERDTRTALNMHRDLGRYEIVKSIIGSGTWPFRIDCEGCVKP